MPNPIVANPGDQYGLLTVIREVKPTEKHHRQVEFKCACGNIKTIGFRGVYIGKVTSCGCYHKSIIKNLNITHGDTKSVEHRTWSHILSRCYNPRVPEYKDYGGRGIKVADVWRSDYPSFLAYMGRRPGPEFSIDRFPNPNGNYEPGNVRWATIMEQARNKRNTVRVEYKGEMRILSELCEELGMNYHVVSQRKNAYGWTGEKLFSPVFGHGSQPPGRRTR